MPRALEGDSTEHMTPVTTQPALTDTRPLTVRILLENDTRHLDGLRRQRGGIGSQSYDEKQKDLRAFFGGAKSDA